jgi:cation transport regulator ChaC
MDYNELDKTLKLLNGFDSDISKRNEIISNIKEKGRICVFAYGSLLWNPIQHFNKFISNCILYNYRKGFFCEDFIYRGTTYFTGLTMGLIKDSNTNVNGALLVSNDDNIIPFLKAFVRRETPINYNGILMDIYKYDLVKIFLPDRINFEYALTCIVNIKSKFYLNKKLTLEEQAKKIGQAYGINGTNFQYLEKLKNIYLKLNINDSFSEDFKELYEKIISYRSSLTINSQKWFEIYDQLQSLEERKEALKKQNSFIFIKDFYISSYFKETDQLSQIEQTI